MKNTILLLSAAIALAQITAPAVAQSHHRHHRKPKSQITELRAARHRDHTVRQVTPDPKKSPGKHADNLSKNVNHEVNRESKGFNHGINDISKGVNHAFQGKKK